ncbi:hypothetical protein [Bradyrhizobium elkanii]
MLERIGRGRNIGAAIQQPEDGLGFESDIGVDEQEMAGAGCKELVGQFVPGAHDQRFVSDQMELDVDAPGGGRSLKLQGGQHIGHLQIAAVAGRCDENARSFGHFTPNFRSAREPIASIRNHRIALNLNKGFKLLAAIDRR